MQLALRLLDILLPKGGYALAFVELYLDESEILEHNLLCVAGYIFRKERCIELEKAWPSVLRGLPYFRSTDCAHRTGPFEGMTDTECDAVQRRAFDVLKQHVDYGIAVTFDLRYRHLCPDSIPLGLKQVTPYTMCLHFCVQSAWKWMEDNQFDGEMAYFFEAGHPSQSESNALMNEMFKKSVLRKDFRYAAHSFIKKDHCGAIQCADILAWQTCTAAKKRALNEPYRKDFDGRLIRVTVTQDAAEIQLTREQAHALAEQIAARIEAEPKP